MQTKTPYLVLQNLTQNSQLEWYAHQIRDYALHVASRLNKEPLLLTRDGISAILRDAHRLFGVRCRVLEIFASLTRPISPEALLADALSLCAIIELIAADNTADTVAKLIELTRACEARYKNLNKHFTVTWSREWESGSVRDSVFWKSYALIGNRPWIQLNVLELERLGNAEENVVAQDVSHPTRSQGEALAKLELLYKAKRAGVSAGGIKPSLNPLVIGSSGSGKSFTVRTLATQLKLPLFETTLGSWLPQGSKSEMPTARRLATFLRNEGRDGAILFIDEADKLRTHAQNSDYSRHLLDEVMGLLSGIVERWEGWSEETAQILREKTFIICAGTFQDLYKDQAERSPDETWQQVSIEDRIWEQQCLPEELLMRLSSSMIELQAPDLTEILVRLETIHSDLGVAMPSPETLAEIGRKILRGRCNLRGLQTYITDLWLMKHTASNAAAERLASPAGRDAIGRGLAILRRSFGSQPSSVAA